MQADFDAIVIGGGFYGCAIAEHIKRQHPNKRVVVIEREASLFRRASTQNQARVHNGYHYPRSFITAFRSRVNLPRFESRWPNVTLRNFTKLYAIAAQDSKTSPAQFERFCAQIGARCVPAGEGYRALFDPKMVGGVYEVEEYAFDATSLRQQMAASLSDLGVVTMTGTTVQHLHSKAGGIEACVSADGGNSTDHIFAKQVFNCGYSGINAVKADGVDMVPLKHELTEMALISLPPVLEDLAVTVMDGPFFSLMPYPPAGATTLSHVRYTPHYHWDDTENQYPYACLDDDAFQSRGERMLRDATRFIPALADARQRGSVVEVKTVLKKNESDDGRPILFEGAAAIPGYFRILGSKIDNVFDVFTRIDEVIAA